MKKTLPFFLLLFSFSLQVWGQVYPFKGVIGDFTLSRPGRIVQNEQGFIYVETSEGLIVKLNSSATKIISIINAQRKNSISEVFVRDIAVDRYGNLYVAYTIGMYVSKFDSNGKFLGFLSANSGDTSFPYLRGLTIDKQGNIYILESDCITKLDSTGKKLLSFCSPDSPSSYFPNPDAYSPGNVAVDSQGNIYILDVSNSCIRKFNPSGQYLSRFGSKGSADGELNLKNESYVFNNDAPLGLVIDDEDNIYVADYGNSRIQKFNKNGQFLAKIGSYGSGDGQFDQRSLNSIALTQNGELYVSDLEKLCIQRFDKNGKFLGKIGAKGTNDGQFTRPRKIAVNGQNHIYVGDGFNGSVHRFDANGNFQKRMNSLFDRNDDIAVDQQGNLLVYSSSVNTVNLYNIDGVRTRGFGTRGSGDGQFGAVNALTTDRLNNIYVSDVGNQRIQKFDANGKFLFKFDFNSALDITTDKQGNVYVLTRSSLYKYNSNGVRLAIYTNIGGLRVAADGDGYIYTMYERYSDLPGYIKKWSPAGTFVSQFPVSDPTDIAADWQGNVYCITTLGVLKFGTSALQTHITGKLYNDKNQNCSFDTTDTPLENVVVVAQPGNYYGISDANGRYEIAVDTGTYTVSQVLDIANMIIQPACPANNASLPVQIKAKGDSTTQVNFANTVTLLPFLATHVSTDRLRRCFASQTVISYSNAGYATAENVKVYVKLPKYLIFKSADKPYTIDQDSNYVFTIGNVRSGEQGTIRILDSVACQARITGLTMCVKAWIRPINYSAGTGWDKADIAVTGKCVENGNASIVVQNIGQESMADSTEFRVFLDNELVFRRNYKLEKNGTMQLKIPAKGKTIRLEADQTPNHPRKSQANLTIEGCVSSSTDVVSKGYVNALPQDDAEPEVAIQCLLIVDSFDPNDKLVSPTGTSNDHYTPIGSELQYTVRFQNTGTDYAYKVVVVDTLSDKLDIATLQMGSASHSYSLKVSGKGRPVLTWTFNGINLPDSTRDQKGSNGFIQFTIKPKADLPERTLIENYADIFFDYNDPVRTNTTANVMYDVPKAINPANQLSESIIDRVMATEPDALKGKLSLYPNPTPGRIWVQSADASIQIEQVTVYNLLGEKQAIPFSQTSVRGVEMNLQTVTKGMYTLFIQTNKGTSIRKVIVQ